MIDRKTDDGVAGNCIAKNRSSDGSGVYPVVGMKEEKKKGKKVEEKRKRKGTKGEKDDNNV